VAWAIGPSTHPEAAHEHAEAATATAIDPVCGMTVDPVAAAEKGLQASHASVVYFFCGRGCKLDFLDEPERFFAPGYVPSM
jgi:Cu+-exporting ATPase